MSSSNDTRHFVRISGKILGPFDIEQLRSLKSRGRLHAEHEVSTNRRSWMPASSLEELFRESSAAQSRTSAAAPAEPEPVPRSIEWFYAVDDQQQGPVTYAELKKLVSRGVITGDDLIWHSGLTEWIPVRSQPGLISAKKGRRSSSRADYSPMETHADSQTLIWTVLLQSFRDLITVTQLRSLIRSLATIGGIAILLTMGMVLAFYMTLAVKTDTLMPVIAGAGVLLLASMLRFIGIHSLQAGEELIFNSPQQFSSLSFVKVISVLLLTLGITISAIFFLAAIELDRMSEKIPLLMGASGLLFVSIAGASLVLQPEGMNISVVPGGEAGREGIAILSFNMKLLMRLSTCLFVACAVLACASYGTAAYLVAFERKQEALVSLALLDPTLLSLTTTGTVMLLTAGLVPLAAYLYFAVGSITLEVCESILRLSKSSTLPQAEQPRSMGIESLYE